MVLFVANQDDKQSASFHIWNGLEDITHPSVVSDEELQRPRPSVSDDEMKSDHEYKLQITMPSVSHDDVLHRSHTGGIQHCWKLKHGLAALTYNYLLAFFYMLWHL
jgi:hypothetical protein